MQNRIFLNSLNNGVIILDKALQVVFWNTWLEAHTGKVFAQEEGKRLDAIFPEVDAKSLERKIKNTLRLGTPSFLDASVSHYLFKIPVDKITYSSFEYMQQNITIAPYDMENELVSVMIYDQTPLLEMRRRVMTMNDMLEKRVTEEVEKNRQKDLLLQQQSKQAAMGEMISAIAHQWRQPLNTIATLAQDFEDAFAYNEMDLEYIRKNTGEMMAQIDYMSHTIEDFRNFFKPDKVKNGFNLTETIDEVFHLLSSQLKNSAIEYSLINRLMGSDLIYGYENELKQVLINLINNARDAIVDKMREGGMAGIGQIRIIVENVGEESIRIGVCDNAGGIDAENIKKIFEPYFTTKPEELGTGIGLSIARQIVEEHFGGELGVSNDEQGAKFMIRLPKITRMP